MLPLDGKRRLAGQAPVQRAAQGVDVGADVHACGVLDLLRGHVVEGAQQHARLGHAGVKVPGQAEVEQLGLPFGRDADVGRLDVAMDEVVLVGLGQGRGDLVHQVAGLGGRLRPVVLDVLFQVLARHVLHDEEVQHRACGRLAGGLAGVDGGDDVGMLQLGDGADLGEEAAQDALVLVGTQRQHLDGHLAAHADVLGPEDDAHAAGAEPIQDAVIAEDQAEGRAGLDAGRLVFGQQVMVHQPRQQQGRVVAALELRGPPGASGPSLRQE